MGLRNSVTEHAMQYFLYLRHERGKASCNALQTKVTEHAREKRGISHGANVIKWDERNHPYRSLYRATLVFLIRGESHIDFVTLWVVPTLRGGGIEDHDAKKLKLLTLFAQLLLTFRYPWRTYHLILYFGIP